MFKCKEIFGLMVQVQLPFSGFEVASKEFSTIKNADCKIGIFGGDGGN